MDTLCLRQLNQADNLYRQPAKDRSKRIRDLADNLISGAKIARDHREYDQGINKSGRASKLLDPNVKLVIQLQN